VTTTSVRESIYTFSTRHYCRLNNKREPVFTARHYTNAVFARTVSLQWFYIARVTSYQRQNRRIFGDSAQSLYALRHHGMTEIGLHAVFRAVVVSRLTYASPAWNRFITATDRQRVDAFLSRSKRCGFCPAPDMPDFNQLLEVGGGWRSTVWDNIEHHTLYQQLLPPQSAASQNYNLRRRTHDRQLH